MTLSLAAEGAERGVRVNTISPGFVTSPDTDQFVGDGLDIAHLVVYRTSDESVWLSGQNISIDGGVTAAFR